MEFSSARYCYWRTYLLVWKIPLSLLSLLLGFPDYGAGLCHLGYKGLVFVSLCTLCLLKWSPLQAYFRGWGSALSLASMARTTMDKGYIHHIGTGSLQHCRDAVSKIYPTDNLDLNFPTGLPSAQAYMVKYRIRFWAVSSSWIAPSDRASKFRNKPSDPLTGCTCINVIDVFGKGKCLDAKR